MVINFVLLVIEMWLLSAVVLILHHISDKYGLTPFLFLIGGLVGIARIASIISVYVKLTDSLRFTVSGSIYIPLIVASILILYIANGTVPARTALYSVIGIEILGLFIITILHQHLLLPGGGNSAHVDAEVLVVNLPLQTVIASILAFIFDLYAIVIIYQAFINHGKRIPRWLALGATLWLTLLGNDVIFWVIVAGSPAEILSFLPGNLVGSTISVLFLWPLVSYYLLRIVPQSPHFVDISNRPTFDLLFGNFGKIEQALTRSENALRDIRTNYSQLTDSISEAFWISDPEMEHFYYLSPAFETIWCVNRENVYANPAAFFLPIHAEDKARVFASISADTSTTYDEQFRLVCLDNPDSQIRWIRARMFPIQDNQNNIYRMIGLATDITTQKEFQQREFELAAEREKVRFMRNFISEASHDLRNPLATINMKVYLLERTTDPKQRQTHMNELQAQTRRAAKLIDNILTLSRLETNSTLVFNPFDVHHILREAIEITSSLGASKSIDLIIDFDPDPLLVMAEETELMRGFNNVIDNAYNYTPNGGTVTLQTRREGANVCISISDTGIGIDPSELPYIFQRNFRAKKTGRSSTKGNGLGLTITKTVIERHKGTINVDSTLGKGTTFTILLPRLGPQNEGNAVIAIDQTK